MATEKQHVPLTRCFYCGKGFEILLATRYRKRPDGSIEPVKDLSEWDGKVTTMEPCPECKERMEQGVILLGVRDGEPDRSPENPHRTGEYIVVTDEALKRAIKPGPALDEVLTKRFAMIEQRTLKALGLIDGEGNTLQPDGTFGKGDPEE